MDEKTETKLLRIGYRFLRSLSPRQVGLLALFLAVSVSAALAEVASAAALALLASFLGAGAAGTGLGKLSDLASFFRLPVPTGKGGLMAAALLSGLVLFLANGLQIFAFFLRTQVSLAGLRRVRAVLAEYYFSRDLGFYSRSHSSEAIAAILSESYRLYNSILSPTAAMIHAGTVALVLAVAAIAVNPAVGLAAGLVFAAAYTLYYFALRPVFHRSDTFLAKASGERQKILQQAFEGMREFLFWDKRGVLLEDFKRVDVKATRGEALSLFFASIPRNVLEILIVLSALLLGLFAPRLAVGSIGLGEVVFYGFAMLRLLPAMQQIFAAIAQLQMGRSAARPLARALEELRRENHPVVQDSGQPLSPPHKVIELRDVSFRHEESREWALCQAHIAIPVGSLVAFVGPTGSGKSTAVDILAGLLVPQEGGLWVDGTLLAPERLPAWRRHLAYLPQNFYLLDATARENIALGSSEAEVDQSRVEEAARAAHLDGFIRSLPLGYRQPLGERGVRLSGGQRQRLGLARVLYSKAPVLLLDEPTSALDPETESGILDTISELKGRHTIVLITHREGAWQRCDLVYRFASGKVFAAKHRPDQARLPSKTAANLRVFS